MMAKLDNQQASNSLWFVRSSLPTILKLMAATGRAVARSSAAYLLETDYMFL